MPSGGVPVDQTAEPLTVTLPPPAAGLGSRATCSLSVPAGGSVDVTGGPVVLGGWVVLGGSVVLGARVVLGGRVGTYTGAGGLIIFTVSFMIRALSGGRSMAMSQHCMTACSAQVPGNTHACMLCERGKAQGLTSGQPGSTVMVVVPAESPKNSLSSEKTAVMTKVPPAQLQRSVVLSSYVPTAVLSPSMSAHACQSRE